MNKCFLYTLCSLSIQSIIVFGMYISVQPDPKGIGFFILSFGYSFICSIVSCILLFTKNSHKKFIYYFFMIGDCISLFYLYQLLEQIRRFPPLEFNFLHTLTIIGCLLLAGMVGNMFTNFLNPQEK